MQEDVTSEQLDGVIDPPPEDATVLVANAIRKNTNALRVEDMSNRMALERIHEMAEWNALRSMGKVQGEKADDLLKDLARSHRRRDEFEVKVAVTDMLLQEAREDLAYRAEQATEHLKQIAEMTALLKEQGITVKRRQFQPGKGLHHDRKVQGKKRG